ncbi:MAG: flagellar biosynthesis anti-sigma factor FlgM [Fibromonadales bacterium]|nr:flagellar biosynthesis anti-sigma factor FlgM [Fibromonadales bacterium]
MQISNVHAQSVAVEYGKKKETAKQATVPDTGKHGAVNVSISADASKSSSAEALVTARANALPEIREDKVAVAKERMESGYYNTAEFSGKLAARLVDG